MDKQLGKYQYFKGVREEYYKGWKDGDFKALLADLGYPINE